MGPSARQRSPISNSRREKSNSSRQSEDKSETTGSGVFFAQRPFGGITFLLPIALIAWLSEKAMSLASKLANPKLYMALDPALTYDWHGNKFYPVTALTLGYKLGAMLGGKGQMFIKPSFGLGGAKPTGWGIQTGFQLLNF